MSDVSGVCGDGSTWRRRWRAGIVASAFAAAVLVGPAAAAPRDLAGLSRDDIVTLQRRLVDAGCLKGEPDGRNGAALAAAVKACPDQDPVLRIETGMHTTAVNRVGVDTSCSVAVTAADDKTVRLWSLPDGKLQRTQRLPVHEGDEGKVFAVALSPDGKLVAAGGWDAHRRIEPGHYVYLFEAGNTRSVRRVGSFSNVILHLEFSPTGSRLAVSLGSGQGVHIVDVASGRIVSSDTDYTDASYGSAFGPNGELFVSSYDGYLRRYGPDGRRTHKVATNAGKRGSGVAVSPDGRRVAVGFADAAGVELFDAAALRRFGAAETADVKDGYLSTVAWSAAGQLLAGGRAQRQFDGVWRHFVRTFDAAGKRIAADRPVSGNTVFDLQACGDKVAFTTADPSFGLLGANAPSVTLGRGHTPDMRSKLGQNFTVSSDGTRIRLGLRTGATQPVLVDLGAGTLTDAPDPIAGLEPPNTDRLPITNWENERSPKLGAKALELKSYESARSVAVRPDRSGFVLGGDFSLRAYAADGRELWPKPRDVPDTTWGVNLARGGDLIVAVHDDGTIRWHRWSDGQELLALFIHKDDRRFVAWTPTGYYMASPGAEDLIGWHVNRGWEQPADFFPASRFRERFNRPDIVKLILETLDEAKAVTQANAASRKREDTQSLAARLPPVVRITSPALGSGFSGGEVQIGYELRSPSGLAVDKVDVLIDGRPLTTRGFDRRPPAGGSGVTSGSVGVNLPAADVEVSLVARSGDLASEPATLRLRYAGAPVSRGEAMLKPKLYALVVGVSDYVDPTLKLGYAAKDARDFAAALSAQSGGMYGAVEVRLVTDRQVTRSSLVDGLEWLEKEVTSRDVGLLFLAGHGITDNRQGYWYLPADATPERVRVAAVSQDEIRRSLGALAGKALLFLDTCHAGRAVADGGTRRGGADINAVVNEFAAAENGIVAFASSTGREVSLERDDWGNGAFTKALLEGLLQGKADLLGKGTITLSQLDAFLASRVKELTGGTQHPNMTRPATVPDYPIALVRR